MSVTVYPFVLYVDGQWMEIGNVTLNLSAQVPATVGKCRMVLISVDTSGNLVQTAGSEVDLASLAPLTDTPQPPLGTKVVLGAVRCYQGQTATQMGRQNKDILDLRWFAMEVGGSDATGEILDLATTETDITLRLAPDGAGGVAWAAGGTSGSSSGLAYAEDAISDPPQKEELSAVFGDPATVGAGFGGVIKNTAIPPKTLFIATDGTSWFHQTLTKSLSIADGMSNFPNLVRWFDAKTITGLTDSTPVDQWNDLSGNDAHFISSGTARPLYITAGLNGYPAVRTDGSDDYLSSPGLSLANLTLVSVLFIRNRTADNAGIISFTPASGSDWNNVNGLAITNHSSDSVLFAIRETGGDSLALQAGAGSEKSTPQIITLRLNVGVATWRINGIQVAQDTYNNLTPINFSKLILGARGANDAPGGPYNSVDFGELGIYEVAMLDSDVAALEAILMSKWGIT